MVILRNAMNATFQRYETLRVGGVELRLFLDENGALCAVELPKEIPAALDAETLKQIIDELSKRNIALGRAGDFTRRVWERMREIPAGETMTYSALAAAIGNPRAARAVGAAVGANPLLILLPCHRVVAKNGLGGFREGLAWKEKLLALEQSIALAAR